MTPEQFAKEWKGELSKMPRDVARGLRVPAKSQTFLIGAGLPVDVGFNGIGFDLSGSVLRRMPDQPALVRLSIDTPGKPAICVDEAAAGRVIQIQDGRPEVEFLNSSVEQHAHFWLAWRALVASSRGREDGVTAALLRRAFRVIDPAALATDEHPWSVLIHEVESGVL